MSNEPQFGYTDPAHGGATGNTLFHSASEHRDAFEALARPRNRRILALLDRRNRPLSAHQLATLLVAETEDVAREAVSDQAHRRVLVALVHNHLPTLEAAGLIERDEHDRVVTAASRAYPDALMPVRSDDRTPSLGPVPDEHFDLLTDDRRRTLLSVLEDLQEERTGPVTITVEELARAVSERERQESAHGLDEDERRLVLSLHHRHLPRLDDAGVVEYDPFDETVRYGHDSDEA